MPKLGPFASNAHFAGNPNRQTSYAPSTRQQRQSVPYYAKPVKVQIATPQPEQSSGLLSRLTKSATHILNRIIGRQAEEPASDTQTVIVRDHQVDVSGNEMDYEEFNQLQQIPPFSINKVDQINFFNTERSDVSHDSRPKPSLIQRKSASQIKRSYLESRQGEERNSPVTKRPKVSEDTNVQAQFD